jgi:hypothetical protein
MRSQLPLLAFAFHLGQAVGNGPFLTQLDNQTWVFGNDLWNVTEGPYYATKLYSSILPGHDLVGTAYGHYAGIGETKIRLKMLHAVASAVLTSLRWREQPGMDVRVHCLPRP